MSRPRRLNVRALLGHVRVLPRTDLAVKSGSFFRREFLEGRFREPRPELRVLPETVKINLVRPEVHPEPPGEVRQSN